MARVSMGGATLQAVHKHPTIQHEGYRRLVAALRCIHCLRWGHSQCAHANTGKAAGKKLMDDRLTFPLCASGPGWVGCHDLFDQGALFLKLDRRAIEPVWCAQTRADIRDEGLWPADLAPWPEDEPLILEIA